MRLRLEDGTEIVAANWREIHNAELHIKMIRSILAFGSDGIFLLRFDPYDNKVAVIVIKDTLSDPTAASNLDCPDGMKAEQYAKFLMLRLENTVSDYTFESSGELEFVVARK